MLACWLVCIQYITLQLIALCILNYNIFPCSGYKSRHKFLLKLKWNPFPNNLTPEIVLREFMWLLAWKMFFTTDKIFTQQHKNGRQRLELRLPESNGSNCQFQSYVNNLYNPKFCTYIVFIKDKPKSDFCCFQIYVMNPNESNLCKVQKNYQ